MAKPEKKFKCGAVEAAVVVAEVQDMDLLFPAILAHNVMDCLKRIIPVQVHEERKNDDQKRDVLLATNPRDVIQRHATLMPPRAIATKTLHARANVIPCTYFAQVALACPTPHVGIR